MPYFKLLYISKCLVPGKGSRRGKERIHAKCSKTITPNLLIAHEMGESRLYPSIVPSLYHARYKSKGKTLAVCKSILIRNEAVAMQNSQRWKLGCESAVLQARAQWEGSRKERTQRTAFQIGPTVSNPVEVLKASQPIRNQPKVYLQIAIHNISQAKAVFITPLWLNLSQLGVKPPNLATPLLVWVMARQSKTRHASLLRENFDLLIDVHPYRQSCTFQMNLQELITVC